MQDLRDAVSFHQLLLSANGASPATIAHYVTYETAFLEYLEHKDVKPALGELNVRRVTDFLVWYRNQDRGARTRGGEVAVKTAAKIVKRLGAILEENEYLETNPLAKLATPRVAKHLRQPFDQQEVNALWGACFRTQAPARDEALFLLLLDTGMRIGEATSLRLDNLHLDQREVVVMGKGRRERVVPIGDPTQRSEGRLLRAIRRHLQLRRDPRPAGEPYVFLGRDGNGLAPAGGHEIIKRVGELASVEDVYPHRLRHTFCTWYLTMYPGDELGLRRIVGHMSKDVLADYTHISQNAISQRAGRASLAEQWLGHSKTFHPRYALSVAGGGDGGRFPGFPAAAADHSPRKSRPLTH